MHGIYDTYITLECLKGCLKKKERKGKKGRFTILFSCAGDKQAVY